MNAKLTLSLRQEIIEQAKIYAKEKGISLSFLIENYLQKIIGEYEGKKPEKSSITDELSGIVKLPQDFDYKEAHREYLLKKYS